MKPNPGHLPNEAVGRRVRGRLANGNAFGGEAGWAADGKGCCRWSRTGDPRDIETYEVIA